VRNSEHIPLRHRQPGTIPVGQPPLSHAGRLATPCHYSVGTSEAARRTNLSPGSMAEPGRDFSGAACLHV
jgi:hypothetical protein